MILYPAIDVLDGRVVRLAKGDFNAVTDYGGDPAAIARSYAKAGATWLHLVDLSGARDGRRRQTDLVQTLSDTGLKIQTGGGVRTSDDVEALLDAGADRVVVGSLAVTRPETVQDWLRRYGAEAIAAAFDVRIENGAPWPVVKGWTERAEFTLGELLAGYGRSGLRHALATDVGRDGMLGGPNTDLYRDLARSRPDIAWQASGGVSSLEDLTALKAAGASGAIIGRALFEKRFTLDAALAC
ncbi:1-(5-phosphoribosyl)-5-[(5-phosphoribosylamino)methylideneamino]imidazole-4-carboxamide isomerase [Glycocaulis profundi]|nr:1-(5-phosphoribosyl)-5-[(5-phosphoribosylamino)methylideneamino]imidazole-4-carboxamide isomerase [Glycocaulis profundi]